MRAPAGEPRRLLEFGRHFGLGGTELQKACRGLLAGLPRHVHANEKQRAERFVHVKTAHNQQQHPVQRHVALHVKHAGVGQMLAHQRQDAAALDNFRSPVTTMNSNDTNSKKQ